MRHRTTLGVLPALLFTLFGCENGGPAGPGSPDGAPRITLTPVVHGLSQPVFLTAPAGDDRLFVVEQPGRIRIVKDGALLPTPFLDLTGRVVSGGERGLLGLAFHPEYATNGQFYVSYTGAGGSSVLERYVVTGNPDLADPGSASLLLTVEQPFSNHNGGQVSFGPDGKLYLAFGDGGSGGDPQGHGQNRTTLLGTLLRLDVDGTGPYTIPPDNPFADGAQGRPEIWGYGLRNPWRFSHDPESGLLIIADVGQNEREEINFVPASAGGLNYGWRIMEGDRCYNAASCNQTGLTLPALTYGHGSGSGQGCSVTGGYIYRGEAISSLRGWYLYGDYCGGWVRGLRYVSGAVQEDHEMIPRGAGSITSFGVDGAGELYVLMQDGRVLRVEEVEETGP